MKILSSVLPYARNTDLQVVPSTRPNSNPPSRYYLSSPRASLGIIGNAHSGEQMALS
jgi:hypothetical protein